MAKLMSSTTPQFSFGNFIGTVLDWIQKICYIIIIDSGLHQFWLSTRGKAGVAGVAVVDGVVRTWSAPAAPAAATLSGS